MNSFTVSTLNINKGMLNLEKLFAIKNFLQPDDVILLQETRGYDHEQLWKKYFDRKGKFSFFEKNSRGVGVLAKDSFDAIRSRIDQHGRVAGVLYKFGEQKIAFISVYCPNISTLASQEDHIRTLITIESFIDDFKTDTDMIIVGGDLNIIMDPTIDAETGGAQIHRILVEEVHEMMDRTGLTDVYRHFYPDRQTYTFSPRGANPNKIFRRLDYFLVSETILEHVEGVTEKYCHLSDHKLLRLSIVLKDKQIQKGYWKHNDSLLEIPEYVKAILQTFNECTAHSNFESEPPDNSTLWEFCKYSMAKSSRDFGAQLKKEKNLELKNLLAKLSELENNAAENNTEIVQTKEEIDALNHEEDRKIMFQSRVHWIENNEKMTKFFFRKLKQNMHETNIIQLEADGRKLDPKEINKVIYDYYRNLFKYHKAQQAANYFKDIMNNLPQITTAEKDMLSKDLTEKELTATVFSRMNTGKSPGSDGLTVAFYKKFWGVLKEPLHACLLQGIQRGSLTSSQQRSIVRLIQKKGKDTSLIKNWRPISLMNVDSKIFSRTITARLEKVLGSLCSEEQLAFVKGRNIVEGIRLIDYAITSREQENKQGYIVAFDFEKAFDSINHDYIYQVLQNLNFPEEFIHMIRTLYNGANSSVINNAMATPSFMLERSCRQGDCLSPYLFILAIEPLIRAIKSSEAIAGFPDPTGKKFKVSVYADDMTGFVNNEEELCTLLNIMEDFGKFSGLKLNVDKTEVLPIGMATPRTFSRRHLQDIKVVEHLKITGIYFGCKARVKATEGLNFDSMINKMTKTFNSWNKRDLTIMGRAMLAKTSGLSLLQFMANSIAIPSWVVTDTKKIIYKFIYKGVDKITRRAASKPINFGGLNMPIVDDLVAAASQHWINRARVNPDRSWARFFKHDLGKLGGIASLNSLRTTKHDESDGILPYNQYFRACWQHIKSYEEKDNNFLLDHVLWKNGRFSYRHKQKRYFLEGERLFRNGYTRVGDFIDKDGRIIEAEGLQGFTHALKLEWAGAVTAIKRYCQQRKSLPTTFTKGYTNKHNIPLTKNLDSQEVSLRAKNATYIAGAAKQGDILKFIKSTRLEEHSPFMARLKKDWNLDECTINIAYAWVRKISFATKTRNFVFKLLNGLLYGNNRLHAMGFSESKGCEFCECDKQDILHLLISCPRAQEFRLTIYTKLHINPTLVEEILGNDSTPMSYILLMMNKFIYQRKFLKLPLNHHEFIASLHSERLAEEAIAIRKHRENIHILKWNKIRATNIFS